MEKYIDSQLGLIKIFENEDLKELENIVITIGTETLKPNDLTTLNNFFNDEVKYLGLHNGYMQFEVGKDVDLFGTKIYSNEFKKISDIRMMNIYQSGTARDYNFKKGIWK